MNESEALSIIRRELSKKVDLEYKKGAARFFREKIKPYGVRTPVVRAIAEALYRELRTDWDYDDFAAISERLLRSGWFEEAVVAFTFMAYFKKAFDDRTFQLFEHWIEKYVKNWAHCDYLSADLIGSLVEKKPELTNQLLKWTKAKNRWKRRSAAVSLVIPARHGRLLSSIFAIAERLMEDQDDLVQKGVGWLLKEASRKHEREIVNFLLRRKNRTSRVILRYAVEKMSMKNKRLVLA